MPLGPEFVSVRGGRFELAGSPFPIVGANNYYLAFASEAMRASAIAVAKEFDFNVLRAWAFLDCRTPIPGKAPKDNWRGTYFQAGNPGGAAPAFPPEVNEGEDGLRCLDRLIADADQAGIRLILPLVNHWPNFGGMDCYVGWFGAGARDRFYRDAGIRAAYQAYVKRVLTRFNVLTSRFYWEEPAILAWELANEPQCNTSDGRTVLLEWVRTMGQWVKQWDRNHLLAVGDEGYFANGKGDLYDGRHGVDCEAFLRVAEVDFGTFHLYPQAWQQKDPIVFGMRWIEEHLAAGEKAGKPMLMEEYGMTVWKDGLPSALPRNYIYRCWLHTILSKNGAGDLAWTIAAWDDQARGLYRDFDHFTLYSPGGAMSVRDHVLQLTKAAPGSGLPPISIPGAGQAVVLLWVTDRSDVFLDENQTTVILRRDGAAIGDPLQLDFSGGAAQLAISVFPLGEMNFEITPRNYEPCVSEVFRSGEYERLFLQ